MSPGHRRDFLRRLGGGVAAAVTGGLAGCSALSGDDRRTPFDVPGTTGTGDGPTRTTVDVDFGPVEAPDPGRAVYRRWLPAPGRLPDGFGAPGEEGYGVEFADVAAVREAGDAVPSGYLTHRRYARLGLDALGIPFIDYERVVRIGPVFRGAAVVEAGFDRAATVEYVAATGYDPAGEHRGHRLFARKDDPRAMAVGDGVVVLANPPRGVDPVETVETVVDAGAGAVDRYAAVDGEFDRLAGAAGGPPVASLSSGAFPILPDDAGEVGPLSGLATTNLFDEDRTYLRDVFRFEEREDPDAVRRSLRTLVGRSPRFGSADAVEVSVDARRAVVLAAFEDRAYSRLADRLPETAYPGITWGFDVRRGDDSATVMVTHEAGVAVPANALTLQRGDSGSPVRRFATEYDTVEPGDSVSADLRVGSTPIPLAVRWHPDESGLVRRLAEYRLEPAGEG